MNDLDAAIKYYETAKTKNIHVSSNRSINMLYFLKEIKERLNRAESQK